ncbi:hypothetical protein [Burkholderia savannae]|uniref:hypothetical protein n=1 Tax=Burkholderia savannae TaxID=1637837 RepID=UPI0012E3EB4C|nr:hypothetical protein [Burkholderia savannae]
MEQENLLFQRQPKVYAMNHLESQRRILGMHRSWVMCSTGTTSVSMTALLARAS